MLFRLKENAGKHVHKGVVYRPGELIDADTDLQKAFPLKFERDELAETMLDTEKQRLLNERRRQEVSKIAEQKIIEEEAAKILAEQEENKNAETETAKAPAKETKGTKADKKNKGQGAKKTSKDKKDAKTDDSSKPGNDDSSTSAKIDVGFPYSDATHEFPEASEADFKVLQNMDTGELFLYEADDFAKALNDEGLDVDGMKKLIAEYTE